MSVAVAQALPLRAQSVDTLMRVTVDGTQALAGGAPPRLLGMGTSLVTVMVSYMVDTTCDTCSEAWTLGEGFSRAGAGGGVCTGITFVMVEVTCRELVEVLSKPPPSVMVITETTGDTDTTTAVDED
jgi:hypothetical protein